MASVAELFAKNLKQVRTDRRMTQAALAQELGLSDVAVYNYEKGLQFPRPDVMDSMCRILRIRPWQLLAAEGEGSAIPSELVAHVAAAARACGLKVGGTK